MIKVIFFYDKLLSKYGQTNYSGVPISFDSVLYISSPNPGTDLGSRCHELKPGPKGYQVEYECFLMSEWLSRDGLLENCTKEKGILILIVF